MASTTVATPHYDHHQHQHQHRDNQHITSIPTAPPSISPLSPSATNIPPRRPSFQHGALSGSTTNQDGTTTSVVKDPNMSQPQSQPSSQQSFAMSQPSSQQQQQQQQHYRQFSDSNMRMGNGHNTSHYSNNSNNNNNNHEAPQIYSVSLP